VTASVPSIRAVLVPVGQVARTIDLPEQGLYRRILAILGGPLERFVSFPLDRAGRSADCWCNEDGLNLQLGPNRLVRVPRFRAAVMGPGDHCFRGRRWPGLLLHGPRARARAPDYRWVAASAMTPTSALTVPFSERELQLLAERAPLIALPIIDFSWLGAARWPGG
jgi:hypothetical protein